MTSQRTERASSRTNGAHPTEPDALGPRDLAAERALLGDLLFDASRLDELIGDGLDGSQFVKPAHQVLFDAIAEAHFAGDGPVDEITLRSHLERNGLLDAIGDTEGLLAIREAATGAWRRHARTLIELARRRRLTHAARDVERAAIDGDDTSLGRALDRLDAARTEAATARPSSWEPMRLGSLMTGLAAGSIDRPTPTVGTIDEHPAALIYPARVNGLYGKGGDGKTWIAHAIAAQELAAGHRVWLIDFEDDPLGAADRFLALGADPDTVDAHLRYVHPTTVLDLMGRARLASAIADDAATLVVIDSAGEWMGIEDVETNRDEKVAAWFQRCARPLAAAGPAVLLIDHLPHVVAKGRLSPTGSTRKYNAVDGASYMVTQLAEFGRDRVGRSRLTVAKDRLGTRPRGAIAAEFTLDATATPYTTRLALPAHDDHDDGPLADEKPAVRRVWAAIQKDPAGAVTVREIGDLVAADRTTGTGLQARTIQDALTRMRDLGLVDRDDTAPPYRWYVRPTPSEDPENAL